MTCVTIRTWVIYNRAVQVSKTAWLAYLVNYWKCCLYALRDKISIRTSAIHLVSDLKVDSIYVQVYTCILREMTFETA